MNQRRAGDSKTLKAVRAAEGLAILFTLVGMTFGAYFMLDSRHASQQKLLQTEIDLRTDILDRDIKKQAEARVYYKNLQKERPLNKAELGRLEYLEEQLDRKYAEQDRLEQHKMEVER